MAQSPTLVEIDTARRALKGRIVRTPVVGLNSAVFTEVLPAGSDVTIKLELFQQAGSFKARGVLLGLDGLSKKDKAAGVVAASGGNHAIAVSWASKKAGIHAKITMPETADPMRVEMCRKLGADVKLFKNIGAAFEEMDRLAKHEGRFIMHPFEGRHMTLGAATCGAEFAKSLSDADIFVIPVGGGGLISGMSAAIRALRPNAQIIGVEPYGADSLYRSFEAEKPVAIDKVDTIADSLGSPTALPYSYAVARENVDEIVRIRDAEMPLAMQLLHAGLKLAVEPGCAASLAAILGPLREVCEGKKVGIIACGSNISLERFAKLTGM
ncbi:MAG: threonine/serine dehydratase [Cohaesibacteraceae bacterium]|nr:threonine/serine dehydratase [Cohaesibacteraceae bacterium]MBL4876639.1 threonine/serine dehydratase [Cohaesibacteraceae bacterium]